MQRRLIIMRHAKSSWASDSLPDHDRPLNDRGRAEGPIVAKSIQEFGWRPDQVICSDALRTRQTWELVQEVWKDKVPVSYEPKLYESSRDEYVKTLSALPEKASCVMVVGHNPVCEELTQWLCQQAVVMKTATALLLASSAASWKESFSLPGLWKIEKVVSAHD